MKPCKSFVFFLLMTLVSSLAIAQDQQPPVGKKYLTLYVGTKHREVLSFMPPGAEFSGNYKGFTEILLDRDRKVLDFEPKKRRG